MTKLALNDGSRFSGQWGKKRLIEALKSQTLVSGRQELAEAFAEAGSVERYRARTVLMRQGDDENDLLLVIAGAVSVRVNGREVAVRSAGTHVGEMAVADPVAKRSATVVAAEPTVAVRLPEYRFAKIAERHPDLWRRVAVEIAKRLRERSKYLRQPHNQPVLFIGSSSEGLAVTNAIYRSFVNKPVVPRPWTEGVFQASRTAIEDLVKAAQDADFAVLVLAPDDITTSRGSSRPSPRDNVIFELGLFMGALGRERVFILKPRGVDVRIPSDLLGVVWLEYLRSGKKGNRVKSACQKMWHIIRAAGPV